MEDLTNINNIVASAIDRSSYQTVIIGIIVLFVYTLIQKGTEMYKEKLKSEPAKKQAEAINFLTAKVTEAIDGLQKLFDITEKKEYTRIVTAVNTGFRALQAQVLSNCIEVVVQNNIKENETVIKTNLASTVNTEYYKLYSALTNYEYRDMPISSKINDTWMKELITNCIDLIYKNETAEKRISQLNKYLTVFVDDKSVYLNNLIFNT